MTDHRSEKTTISVVFLAGHEPNAFWRDRILGNAKIAEEIIRSDRFLQECGKRKMTRRNGKTPEQVCRDVQYAGPTTVNIGFYHDTNTSAIAYEADGKIYMNTARSDAAGSPGNIAHELAHQLGYTHFTNFPVFASRSVPGVVGNLVNMIATQSLRLGLAVTPTTRDQPDSRVLDVQG